MFIANFLKYAFFGPLTLKQSCFLFLAPRAYILLRTPTSVTVRAYCTRDSAVLGVPG